MMAAVWVPLVFARRELRAGARGFFVFIAAITLGVMAIAGVGSLARSLSNGLAREARVILGGDIVFTLIHREANAAERAFLIRHGELSVAATLRAMARAPDGKSALVEIKAVDAAYPLYGGVALDRNVALASALARRGEIYGAAADPALLARLDLAPGARLAIGAATVEITALVEAEPDKLAGGIAFGPRLLISEAALRASALLQPGSLVRWHYRLRLADDAARAVATVSAAAQAQLPDAGWEVRSRANVAPALERNIERFAQYLMLVGLATLLIGGIGVANAVKGHLDRKRETIATLKTLGATGGRVFATYLAQVLALALLGAGFGLALGAALPFAVAASHLVPLPIAPSLHAGELALALAYGLLTALAFALWPLGRAHDLPPSALFRDVIAPARQWPRRRYVIAAALCVAVLAALAVLFAHDRLIAGIFVAAAAGVLAALRLVAALLVRLARCLPHARAIACRIAIANIHRPGTLTPTVVVSLGLGLALLVTISEIDGNLRRHFAATLPEKAPAFFFLDIAAAEAERFEAFLRTQAPRAKFERVPMLRGRIVSIAGVRAENLRPAPNVAWVLQGDRGITYAAALPAGSRLVAGQWWDTGHQGPPLVSFEKKVAEGLRLKLGDEVTVNVLGRNLTARLANLRNLDWHTLGINFVMVFSPDAFAGAPHTYIATLTLDGGTPAEEARLIRAVAEAFPAVTTVRVKDALEAVGQIVTDLALAVRWASLTALVAAALVLGGALAASQRHREYDAVVLKTLGATRARLLGAYALEYLLLGLAAAVFGVAAGALAARLVLTTLMELSFVWQPLPALSAALGALALTVALGLIGTFRALGHKAAPLLRNL